MSSQALATLKTVFGYDAFRPPQDEVINHLIDGGDAVVIMPTGGGKSLCYQVPALVRDGVAIVVSPLIALMQDQVATLVQNGVKAAFLNSTMDAQSAYYVEQQVRDGQLDLLYVAPERLMTDRFLSLLDQSSLSLFAIDEAHCVSQWGHDFRPEYIKLSILAQRYPHVPRVALTATADANTRNEIAERLSLQQGRMFISGFDRPNIRYQITQSPNARDALLRFIRSEHEDHAGIVYCLSRKKVEQTAQWLADKGLTALPYHAGLSAEVRQQNQTRFLQEDKVIIVATIAFGMGIDKPDVRFVAHLNLPKSIEAYYQETGRAGRDGLPSSAWMSYGLQDVITLRQMLESSQANDQFKRVERYKLDAILGFCELVTCRRQALLSYFGDQMPEPCGNCDTCLNPVETWDATVVAQKALSCVYRTGERFGVNYLVDVLLGKDNERIKSFGHDKLSVFGIGSELNVVQWRSVFRQLISRDLLLVDIEGHGSLRLAEKCRPFLKGEQTLMLRKELIEKRESRRQTSKVAPERTSENKLWEALRALRKQLAAENDLAPYMIFHDATLLELVEQKPVSLTQMSMITGVGAKKLDTYGEVFVELIADYVAQNERRRSDPAVSIRLFLDGHEVEAIAEQQQVKEGTIYNHLAKAIETGQLQLEQVIDIQDDELDQIRQAFELQGEEGRLKPVFETFEGTYSYDILKCVKASMMT
ncbi:DNA helicase RecQ [Pleionea sp. CnH1-48]|uniref:DNA helicase RecQ n=1 Tax=Pleionea sp. CnH1-48 TaxID=2954494 RepID=UPI0020975D52|nr:DNA helicase RecQ [Pleionea sp. CnH1-48]